MNKLPPAAAGLLDQTRAADRNQAPDFERTLAELHASLPFADAGGAFSSDGGASANLPAASLHGGIGIAAKAAKLALITLALGGVMGGALMLRNTPQGETGAPGVEVTSRTSDGPAPPLPREEIGTPRQKAAPLAPNDRGADLQHAALPERLFGAAPTRKTTFSRARDESRTGRAAAQATSRLDRVQQRASDSQERLSAESDGRAADANPAGVLKARSEGEIESELDLVDDAFAALRASEPGRALALLERHRSLYPTGTFVTERLGLRVLALCAAGRVEEGRLEQTRFLRSASNSPIAARVRNACEPARVAHE
jgi:hypothetical protein